MHVLFDRVKSEAANIFSAKKKIPVSIFEKSKIPSIQIVTKTILHNLYIRNFWFGSNWRSSFFFGNKTQIFFSPYLSPSRIFLSWNQIMCYESGHITSDRFPQLFPPTGLKTKWLTLHLCFNFSWLLFFNKLPILSMLYPSTREFKCSLDGYAHFLSIELMLEAHMTVYQQSNITLFKINSYYRKKATFSHWLFSKKNKYSKK